MRTYGKIRQKRKQREQNQWERQNRWSNFMVSFSKVGIIKPILLISACIVAGIISGKVMEAIAALLEILALFSLTVVISIVSPSLGNIINFIFFLIIAINVSSLLVVGEYITVIMLENIQSIAANGDALKTYIPVLILGILLALLPVTKTGYMKLYNKKFAVFFICLFCFVTSLEVNAKINRLSPTGAIIDTVVGLVEQKRLYEEMKYQARLLQNSKVSFYRTGKEILGETIIDEEYLPFFKKGFEGGIDKPEELGEYPNVILILTEGMSAAVIDRYNDQGLELTPRIDEFYDNSLVFTDYFNHTAATYRGIRGQLYSGYQLEGGSDATGTGLNQIDAETIETLTDTKLVSLVDLLGYKGYSSCFINPEPYNVNFGLYLKSLGVDEVYSGDVVGNATDKEFFELMLEKAQSLKEPYFLIGYNVGTHNGMKSAELKYKNGNNAVRNKFYDYDHWFGEFIDALDASGSTENTMIVLTTDHASYASNEFKRAIKNNPGYIFVDKIPLIISWGGQT
jgi:hypothetical protein